MTTRSPCWVSPTSLLIASRIHRRDVVGRPLQAMPGAVRPEAAVAVMARLRSRHRCSLRRRIAGDPDQKRVTGSPSLSRERSRHCNGDQQTKSHGRAALHTKSVEDRAKHGESPMRGRENQNSTPEVKATVLFWPHNSPFTVRAFFVGREALRS
jgi:hypothetical protein